MKINYFITHFPYRNHFSDENYFSRYKYGGAELAAYYLALKMAEHNNINVFTTSINSKDSFEEYKGIQIHRYGTNFTIEKGNISFGLFRKPLNYDADIVHAHFSTPPAEIAALLYAKKKKIPFILTYHGDWQESFGGITRRIPLYFYNKFLIRRILDSTDLIIVPSKYYINESRFLGEYKDKITVIPNGINIKDFEIPLEKEECRQKLGLNPDKNIILFLGNLIQYKGPEILIKAMKLIVEKVPNTELILVGEGRMKEELENLSKDLNIEKCVKFVGFVGDIFEKALYYKAADVFCLPSTMSTEVFPIVLLEASASGLPMVVSDLQTFKCIIEEGYNGFFIKRHEEKDLAYKIIYLLKNKNKREEMGENANKKVKSYSWEHIANYTERIYEMVTQDK